MVRLGTTTWLLQCKAHAKRVGPEPFRALLGVLRSGYAGGSRAIMVALGGVTEGAQRFAAQNDILIWDVDDVVAIARGDPLRL